MRALYFQSIFRLLLLVALLGAQFESIAQDVVLLTQAEVDAFDPSTTVINGDLRIGTNLGLNYDITLLTNLSNLKQVTGNLELYHNVNLLNLEGLSSLSSIGGQLTIHNNDSITNLDGLNSLISIGEDLTISHNNQLTNIDALRNITTIWAGLNIASNDNLQNLDGLKSITYVDETLYIFSNSNLSNCCGIQNLVENQATAVGGSVTITFNRSECSTAAAVIGADCSMEIICGTTPSCVGAENGSIQIYIDRYDTIPFYYEWIRQEDGNTGNGVSQKDDFVIDMLGNGTYNLTVTNTEPDTAIKLNIVLSQKVGHIFEIIKIQTTNSSNGANNGSITLTTAGGTKPYRYTWTGEAFGSASGVVSDFYTIPLLGYGEYTVVVEDSAGKSKIANISLLDETVQVIPCEEPLDIVILNDVSGSVDATEYEESKQFFVDILKEVNIGTDADKSRAAILEWSHAQDIKIEMTGDSSQLQQYTNMTRSFANSNATHSSIQYAADYLIAHRRPGVKSILILSTDGVESEIPPSLVPFVNGFKLQGIDFVTIAFDYAYTSTTVRQVLSDIASGDGLAPGAISYSQLAGGLAKNIVFNYLCPIDPGSSATAYFNRDGAIDITAIDPVGNCPFPDYVEITIDISAYRELSIPAGTPITFYHNNPNQSGASPILTWEIPCAIAADSTETYTITLPINGPSNIFAVLNDDGFSGPPISFPITEIEEITYSNNIDNERICLDEEATIQAFKYSSLPIPSCDTLVNYTINVCNISEVDAFDVSVTDISPQGFVLNGIIFNDGGCAVDMGGTYDIPAECCFSLYLTYDASAAVHGYYGNQSVNLHGPIDQTYIDFDGSTTTAEDVTIDGSIDCPSTIIEFTKAVNSDESCDDGFVQFTFTINNEMNIPLQGLTFRDVLPDPCTWSYIPYGEFGLSIANSTVVGNEAILTIDKVEANTVATFYMDASLNSWTNDGTLSNTATLENVPDVINSGFTTLTSNTTNTQVTASPNIMLPDTIIVNSIKDTVTLEATLTTIADVYWTTAGDGQFMDDTLQSTSYIVGAQDSLNGQVMLFMSAISDCTETGASVLIQFVDCSLDVEIIEIGECDNNGTPLDGNDDTYDVIYIVSGNNVGSDSMFVISVGTYMDTLPYFTEHTLTLPVDGIEDTLSFVALGIWFCSTQIEVNQETCTEDCSLTIDNLSVFDCDDNGTPQDSTDDFYQIEFTALASNPGMDSTFTTLYEGQVDGPFSYDDVTSMTLSADSILDSILVADSNYDTCGVWIVVNQGNCYVDPPCSISANVLSISDCDDNETPQDSTDDFYQIEFTVLASNPSMDSTFTTLYNGQAEGPFGYGDIISMTLSADSVIDSILVVDSNFDSCKVWIVVNQGNCFVDPPCAITTDVLSISDCDDNGTPQDSTDDFYQIEYTILASNPGLDSIFTTLYYGQEEGPFGYGDIISMTLSADSILDSILVVDSNYDSCMDWIVVNQGNCYIDPPCTISTEVLGISDCDANGTPQDSTDDFYQIEFTALASNPGMEGRFTAHYNGQTEGPSSYGEIISLMLSADSNLDSIWVVDSNYDSCGVWLVVHQENCYSEFPCSISVDILNVSDCDDNGTPQDSTDDIFTVEFYVESDSHYHVFHNMNIHGPFQNNAQSSISLFADNFPDTLVFAAIDNENCYIEEIVHQNSCASETSIIDSLEIIIPNVFSPNGDKVNDNWFVTSLGENVKILECSIADRWGNYVFYSTDINPIWDGRFKQKPVSAGVYLYILSYIDNTGSEKKKIGDITVFY